MRIFSTVLLILILSMPSYAKAASHCTACDKTTSLCICLIPEYIGIFHWNFDTAYFDTQFDVNGTTHHYNSVRELHKDMLDSLDIDLLKDAKVTNLHYQLKTINGVTANNCTIDMEKPKAGMYLVTITKQLGGFYCDIQFAN